MAEVDLQKGDATNRRRTLCTFTPGTFHHTGQVVGSISTAPTTSHHVL